MWSEILLLRRYLVGFTIFIFMQNKGQNETLVKLITVTYWIKFWLVTQAQCMIMVYMKVFQFDVCSNCYVLVYWLRTYWEIYEMQYFGYLSVRRYNLVNSISTVYLVVFQKLLLMPLGMCQIRACFSDVLSLHLSHHALQSWDMSTMQLLMERALCWSNANSSVWSRICYVAHAAVDSHCNFDPEISGNILDVCLSCKNTRHEVMSY